MLQICLMVILWMMTNGDALIDIYNNDVPLPMFEDDGYKPIDYSHPNIILGDIGDEEGWMYWLLIELALWEIVMVIELVVLFVFLKVVLLDF